MLTRKWRQRLCGLIGHDWQYEGQGTLTPTRTCKKCGRQETENPNFGEEDDRRWVLTTPYDSQQKY